MQTRIATLELDGAGFHLMEVYRNKITGQFIIKLDLNSDFHEYSISGSRGEDNLAYFINSLLKELGVKEKLIVEKKWILKTDG